MSSSYEHEKARLREIVNFATGKPHNLQPGSTELIRAEIADRYILRYPELALDENWSALKLLLDRKYEELKLAILADQDFIGRYDYDKQKLVMRDYAKLEALGILPRPDEIGLTKDESIY